MQSRGLRAAIAAILLAAAAGCTGGGSSEQIASAGVAAAEPVPNPARGPAITDKVLIAADGASLPLRRWLPRGEVKAVVLALHGFNDYSNAFAMPAALWAQRGIADRKSVV